MSRYLNFDERGFTLEGDSTWTNSEGENKSDVLQFIDDVSYGFYKSLEITDETLYALNNCLDSNWPKCSKDRVLVMAIEAIIKGDRK